MKPFTKKDLIDKYQVWVDPIELESDFNLALANELETFMAVLTESLDRSTDTLIRQYIKARL